MFSECCAENTPALPSMAKAHIDTVDAGRVLEFALATPLNVNRSPCLSISFIWIKTTLRPILSWPSQKFPKA